MIPFARMIHTKIWSSDQVLSLRYSERLLYIGLITYGDDVGRLRGDVSYLKRQFFPYDRIGPGRMEKMLQALHDRGLIIRYQTEAGIFIQHPNWKKYQKLRAERAKESEYPSPPSDICLTDDGRVPAEGKGMEAKQSEINAKEDKVTRPSDDSSARESMIKGFNEQRAALARSKSMQGATSTQGGDGFSVSLLPTDHPVQPDDSQPDPSQLNQ